MKKPICPKCKSMEWVVRRGIRKNKSEKKQMYWCKKCEHRFTPDDGFWKVQYTPNIITAALDMYYKGMSFRKVQDHLDQFHKVRPSPSTIMYWVRKYSKLLKRYMQKLKPKIGGEVHADEAFVRRKESWKRGRKEAPVGVDKNAKLDEHFFYFWDAIDKTTKWLWGFLSEHRNESSAKELYKSIKHEAQGVPPAIFHDGLYEHDRGFNKYFYHISENVRLSEEEKPFNNPIERFQGTVKERTKVMRGLTVFDSAEEIMQGFRAFYNLVRKHMSLKGKTPAQAAGIELNLGRNRWLSLIRI